jgi:AcrR family transcriptional regulator
MVETSMRRMPQRSGAKQRVEAILDAAETLFAEQGYESVTTNAIAAAAHIPIGSVYQYFPNKEAILAAVATRYREGLLAIYSKLQQAAAQQPLGALVAAWVDSVVVFGSGRMGFTRIMLGAGESPKLAAAANALEKEITAHATALLSVLLPRLSSAEHAVRARVCLAALHAVLGLALRLKSEANEAVGWAIIEQAKPLLTAYLSAEVARHNASD